MVAFDLYRFLRYPGDGREVSITHFTASSLNSVEKLFLLGAKFLTHTFRWVHPKGGLSEGSGPSRGRRVWRGGEVKDE